MVAMRELGIEEAAHESERRTRMRLDGDFFMTSRIGVRRSVPIQGRPARKKFGEISPR